MAEQCCVGADDATCSGDGGHCGSGLAGGGRGGEGDNSGSGAGGAGGSRRATTDSAAREGAPHVVIVGGGSAAFAAASTASAAGARVTMINGGLPLGGCCVNVGCVPSKAMLRAGAAVHDACAASMRFDGVATTGRVADFAAVTAHTQRLVDELRRSKYVDVAASLPGLRVIEGMASVPAADTVSVGGEVLRADRVILATGTSTFVPDIPGLAESGYLTHVDVFQLEEVPASVLVLGGRYIALELAQLLSRLGTRVTVLQRSAHLLPTEDADVSETIRECVSAEGITVHTGVVTHEVRRSASGQVEVDVTIAHPHDGSNVEHRMTLTAARIVLATGRRANTDHLGAVDVELDARGAIVVDEFLRTSVPGVFAAGDVLAGKMFVYTAAYEGALAASNALAGEECCMRSVTYEPLPWVVFTDPQVAGVGFDERMAAEAGLAVDVSVCPLSAVPRALAARDTRGFIKLVRRSDDHVIVGARVVAPEGGELLMQIGLAVAAGMTSDAVASMFHPYLTLSEGVKLACIGFDKDIKELSCCAV